VALTPEQITAQQKKILAQMEPRQARGRRAPSADDRMNKTETAYAEHLLARMVDGDVVWFEFEAMKFRLADRCWYVPDFVCQMRNGDLHIIETKGHMEDDAAVKLRVFVRLYPMFPLFIARKIPGGWELEERK
jgi:hypothetical protein